MTPLREKTEYGAVAALLGISKLLPEGMVHGLYRGIASVMYTVLGDRRKLALLNLGIAFPEMSPTDRKRIAKQTFANLAESMAFNTLVMSGRISNERLMDRVEADDWEKVKRIAAASEKGLLVISAHLGNWELLVQYCAFRIGTQVHVITRKIDNRLIEERIVSPLRERFGVKVFHKKNALMRIMKAVNRGEHAGLMIDQRLNPPEGIPVDFFGRKANTAGAPALLQVRFGLTAIPLFLVKTEHRKYRLIIGDAIEWKDNGKPAEEQVAELTRLHQKVIEDIIRQYPDQWFWVHNRWGLPKADR
jgi:KDO2-lipid IV(A) lauroyltransferase